MTIGIIPARGGSKGVPKKNIRNLSGFPLIAYSIAASRLSKMIDRTIVSTDSEEIASIAEKYGAEIPFMRPSELAQDKSPDMDFVVHALKWFREVEGAYPDYLVHLRPTTPLRDPEVIDDAIRRFIANPSATALRSVHELPESPYKMFAIKDGLLEGLYPDDPRNEYYNLPRQAFPAVYNPNGYVDIIKPSTVLDMKSLHGPRMLAFVSENAGEVDRPEDFDYIEYKIVRNKWDIHEYLKNNCEVANT